MSCSLQVKQNFSTAGDTPPPAKLTGTSKECNSKTSACTDFVSQVEAAILSSTEPIQICSQNEPVTVNGETGIWANKAEADAFIGPIPICKYPINQDPCPQVVSKKPKGVECRREVFVKYLEPPKIPSPGPIVINQEANRLPPVAPPVIIRQVPCKPVEPETMVIREAPPQQPKPPYEKVITIPGKLLPPPPRKVVIERLPEQPAKPQDIVLERWLPFKDEKRKIKLNPKPADPIQCKPRNVIINWEKVECSKVNTDIKNLGIEKADPVTYTLQYGSSLKTASELPDIANEVKVLHGIPLAAENTHKYYMELEGDIHALALIDLDKEGLSEYKHYLDLLKNPATAAQLASSTDQIYYENANCSSGPTSVNNSNNPSTSSSCPPSQYQQIVASAATAIDSASATATATATVTATDLEDDPTTKMTESFRCDMVKSENVNSNSVQTMRTLNQSTTIHCQSHDQTENSISEDSSVQSIASQKQTSQACCQPSSQSVPPALPPTSTIPTTQVTASNSQSPSVQSSSVAIGSPPTHPKESECMQTIQNLKTSRSVENNNNNSSVKIDAVSSSIGSSTLSATSFPCSSMASSCCKQVESIRVKSAKSECIKAFSYKEENGKTNHNHQKHLASTCSTKCGTSNSIDKTIRSESNSSIGSTSNSSMMSSSATTAISSKHETQKCSAMNTATSKPESSVSPSKPVENINLMLKHLQEENELDEEESASTDEAIKDYIYSTVEKILAEQEQVKEAQKLLAERQAVAQVAVQMAARNTAVSAASNISIQHVKPITSNLVRIQVLSESTTNPSVKSLNTIITNKTSTDDLLTEKELIDQKVREEESRQNYVTGSGGACAKNNSVADDEEDDDDDDRTLREYSQTEPNKSINEDQTIMSEISKMTTSTPNPSIMERTIEYSIEQKLERLKLEHEQMNEIERNLQEKLKHEIKKDRQKMSRNLNLGGDSIETPATTAQLTTAATIGTGNDSASTASDNTTSSTTLSVTKALTDALVAEMMDQQRSIVTTMADSSLISEKADTTVGDISFEQDEPNSTASLEAAVDFLVEKLVKIVREGSFD